MPCALVEANAVAPTTIASAPSRFAISGAAPCQCRRGCFPVWAISRVHVSRRRIVREFYPSATCYGVTAIYRGLDTTLRYAAAAELTQEHETGCHRRSELVAVLHVVRHDRSRHGLSADRASLFIYPGPIHHPGASRRPRSDGGGPPPCRRHSHDACGLKLIICRDGLRARPCSRLHERRAAAPRGKRGAARRQRDQTSA